MARLRHYRLTVNRQSMHISKTSAQLMRSIRFICNLLTIIFRIKSPTTLITVGILLPIPFTQTQLTDGMVTPISSDTVTNHTVTVHKQSTTCPLCNLEWAKKATLLSIRTHILESLKIPTVNVSVPKPFVGEHVIETFYREHDNRRYVRANRQPSDNDSLDKRYEYRKRMLRVTDVDGADQMYGDDPLIGGQREEQVNQNEYTSITNSIYSFPKLTKARHRGDILEFSIKRADHIQFTKATLHLFISDPREFDQTSVNVTINRLLRNRYTRQEANYTGEIDRNGQYVELNVIDMVLEWMGQPGHSQEMVIKTEQQWMRQLLVLEATSKTGPYIEIVTKDNRRRRTKRETQTLDCTADEKIEPRCCRYKMTIDFHKFGWNFILAPDIYHAYFCAGDCGINMLQNALHPYVAGINSDKFTPCCTPRSYLPISLLYYDDSHQVIYSELNNMVADTCGCS